ncbi:unnamed protein product [Gongylonema pulchrum]|uniref:Ovule protein n=1 Tax=Gongylonema pulchrum TaxID=637853 RepID=A0A183DLF6_9BILA|nr:unnamed protein product [Gongylonema pulchrum]
MLCQSGPRQHMHATTKKKQRCQWENQELLAVHPLLTIQDPHLTWALVLLLLPLQKHRKQPKETANQKAVAPSTLSFQTNIRRFCIISRCPPIF